MQLQESMNILAMEVSALAHAIRGGKSQSDALTKEDLQKTEHRIMSAIKDFSDKVTAAFNDIGSNVDDLNAAVTGIASDVTALKAKIDQLQNSPGAISPEDQALLDQISAQATALSDKVKTVDDAAKALDAATENAPVAPPTA